MNRNLAALVLFALSFGVADVARAQTPAAGGDFLLINGRILTVDPRDSVAQAVAITGGKIVAVGSNEAARQAASKTARVIDLKGRAVTPGLIDAHCHFTEVDALYSVDLSEGVNSIADAMKRGVERVSSLKPGEWRTLGHTS